MTVTETTNTMSRDELHKYLISVAAKSPARKRKVGAVIVRKHMIGRGAEQTVQELFVMVAEGYNYNLSGGPCETEDNITHANVVHAEVACLENLPEDWKHDGNFCMYVTHEPCDGCKATLIAKGLPFQVMGDFMKFDSAKPRMSLVPTSLIRAVAGVLTYGAKKYKANNWRNVKELESYINAFDRHWLDFKDGIDMDPDGSGQKSIDMAATNLAFIIELLPLNLPRIKE